MPSIVSEAPYHHPTTASPSNSFDIAHRKSYDKTPVGNTFLYTAGANGDAGRLESSNFYQQSDHNDFLTSLKNGSAHSLNGARSSIGSYNRERFFSKTDSNPSLASGSFRENREQQQQQQQPPPPSRLSAMSDGYVNGVAGSGPETSSTVPTTTAPAPHANGALPDSRSPTPSARPLPNGDYYRLSTSEDRGSFLDSNQSAYHANNFPLSTSLPNDSSHLTPEPDRLAPPNKRSSQPHRYSSPPAPSDFEPTLPASPSRNSNKSALQVPRSAARRSRDYSLEENRAYSTGRADGSHFRRSSLSLVRRATRTSVADLHPDESLTDEDAARWAEAIKQKRAARKKRREEEDDDRVIVGTKVDQNHVNWVTAYNMLTGIRFVVSRNNAKMDRELTPADFDAKHKFSFDM